jgi:phosphate transport system protein
LVTNPDVTLAQEIQKSDDKVDAIHRELFRIVLAPTWEHGVEAAVDVTLLSRYYERFADHAVSIARRIIHVLTGEPYIDTVLH